MSSPLSRCPRCDGFVPVSLQACPNCEPAHARSTGELLSWARLGLLFRVTAGSAVAMTLMACYGAPPPRMMDSPDDAKATPNQAPDAKSAGQPDDAKPDDVKNDADADNKPDGKPDTKAETPATATPP